MQQTIYLDYAATTPADPRVAEAMGGCLTLDGNFGNPASRSHVFGWRAEEAVEEARRDLADLVQCDPREIVWTSGATESDNLALKGVAHRNADRGRHLVTSRIEHKAVIDSCRRLEQEGFDLTWLGPDAQGRITPDAVAAALRDDTVLVSLMHVNNEIGIVTDIGAIGALTRERGIHLHVDAAQSLGRLPIDLSSLDVDLMSFSGHKIYGPKGIGALYVRRRPPVALRAEIDGGGHERGMRSGTLPTHQIVGFGTACRILAEERDREQARIAALADRLLAGLDGLDGVHPNGAPEHRVPSIQNLGFDGVDGEALLMALNDLALSTGSACTSTSVEPSYVLRALGVPDARAHASLRISLGRYTDEAEVDHAAARIRETVQRLRAGPAGATA